MGREDGARRYSGSKKSQKTEGGGGGTGGAHNVWKVDKDNRLLVRI